MYDFTKAHGYDEDLTRFNLNYVKRADSIKVLAPTLVKEIPVVEPPNYVEINKNFVQPVSKINLNRQQAMMLQSQLEAQHKKQ